MLDPLTTLADLLAAGRRPAEALMMLERAGAAPWAAEARAAVAAGGDPAGALVRAGALGPGEVQDLGGAAAAVEPAALRLIARRRTADRLARRAAFAALALPALGTLSTAATAIWIPRDLFDRLVDILPLIAVTAAVALAARPAFAARLRPLAARLPGAARRRVVHALWAAAPLDAAGFERAARLLPAGLAARACERAGRRLTQGEPLEGALPSAAEVGASTASLMLAGAADPAALTVEADAADRLALARWVFMVRLAGWATVFFISVRLIAALLTADLGDMGELQHLLPGGLDPKAMEDLMREIELP